MSTKTTNYGLIKPELKDPADITAMNVNWDTIDAKIKEYAHEKVPNVTTNDQTPTYSDTNTLTNLQSGEKLNVAFQKIKCAIKNLIDHIGTHKVITYTSLNDIGLTTGSETIDSIVLNMADNSELNLTVGADNADIYPQQYGVLKVIKKNSSRTIFKFYNKSIAYEYLGIYDDTITTKWTGWRYLLSDKDVVDNLTSTATNVPLSAKQGKVLDEKVNKCLNYRLEGVLKKDVGTGFSMYPNNYEDGLYLVTLLPISNVSTLQVHWGIVSFVTHESTKYMHIIHTTQSDNTKIITKRSDNSCLDVFNTLKSECDVKYIVKRI